MGHRGAGGRGDDGDRRHQKKEEGEWDQGLRLENLSHAGEDVRGFDEKGLTNALFLFIAFPFEACEAVDKGYGKVVMGAGGGLSVPASRAVSSARVGRWLMRQQPSRKALAALFTAKTASRLLAYQPGF